MGGVTCRELAVAEAYRPELQSRALAVAEAFMRQVPSRALAVAEAFQRYSDSSQSLSRTDSGSTSWHHRQRTRPFSICSLKSCLQGGFLAAFSARFFAPRLTMMPRRDDHDVGRPATTLCAACATYFATHATSSATFSVFV